jgi:SOS-response transcriptional repressor LexA
MITAAGFEIGQSGVSNIEQRGDTHPQCIYQLALALNVTVEWLQTGRTPKHPQEATAALEQLDLIVGDAIEIQRQEKAAPSASTSTFPPPDLFRRSRTSSRLPQLPRDFPIVDVRPISRVPRHERLRGVDLAAEAMLGRISGFALRVPMFSGRHDAFCIRAMNGRMSPWREEGDLIHVDDRQPPHKGGYIVAVFADKKNYDGNPFWPIIVAQIVSATPSALRLKQFRPPREFEVARDDLMKIYRVVDLAELLSQKGGKQRNL